MKKKLFALAIAAAIALVVVPVALAAGPRTPRARGAPRADPQRAPPNVPAAPRRRGSQSIRAQPRLTALMPAATSLSTPESLPGASAEASRPDPEPAQSKTCFLLAAEHHSLSLDCFAGFRLRLPLLVALTERCHNREGFASDVARELRDGHGHGLPGLRWATCAPAHGQYLSGRGDENSAVYFCSTSWLPHLGHTAFASRSSMWHVTANFRLHFLHLNS